MIEVSLQHHMGAFTLDAAFTCPGTGVTALFGPSGAGKSTLIAAIAGLVTPGAGRIAVNGDVLFDAARKHNPPPEQRRCGVVFQDARLFPHLPVRANLRYGLDRAGPPAPDLGFARVVGLLGLENLLDRRPSGLSGGERQRVALGRALLSQPRLLLLDEPLAALDAPRKAEILPYLDRVTAELTLPALYVSHAVDEVARLADHVVLIDQGRVSASGPVGRVMADPAHAALLGPADLGTVLPAATQGIDETGLLVLNTPAGPIRLAGDALPAGVRRSLRVRARDVAISLGPPEGVSVTNILPATILRIDPVDPFHSLVSLMAGDAPLPALILSASVQRLKLQTGQRVYAMVKSVALERE